MKKTCIALLMTFAPLLGCNYFEGDTSSARLSQLWKTKGLAVPESVLFYANPGQQPYLFVSQIDGADDGKDGKGGVATLSLDGKQLNTRWIEGLNAPKGLAAFNGQLFVTDVDEIVVIDIAAQKIHRKIQVPGAQFLNDIDVDAQGIIYATDTRLNSVFRIENDQAAVFAQGINRANGIKTMANGWLVGAGDQLVKLDAAKNITPFAKGFDMGVDGIEPVGNGDFLVSVWAGKIYYVKADGQQELILDTSAKHISSADIGFDPATQTLYVPTFFNNAVTAYHLKP